MKAVLHADWAPLVLSGCATALANSTACEALDTTAKTEDPNQKQLMTTLAIISHSLSVD